jgi:hypothetical protein
MSEDCGHRCCHIRSNGYHTHANEPLQCERCEAGVRPRVATLTGQLIAHAAGPTVRTAQSPAASDGARRTTSTATTSSWV